MLFFAFFTETFTNKIWKSKARKQSFRSELVDFFPILKKDEIRYKKKKRRETNREILRREISIFFGFFFFISILLFSIICLLVFFFLYNKKNHWNKVFYSIALELSLKEEEVANLTDDKTFFMLNFLLFFYAFCK